MGKAGYQLVPDRTPPVVRGALDHSVDEQFADVEREGCTDGRCNRYSAEAEDHGTLETTGEEQLQGVRTLVRRLAAQAIHNGHGPSAKDHDRKMCMKCLDVTNALAFLEATQQPDEAPEAEAPQDVTLAQ